MHKLGGNNLKIWEISSEFQNHNIERKNRFKQEHNSKLHVNSMLEKFM
jgi:hypothetical protein